MRYLCLDLGLKRIGVATSASGLIASPHAVIQVAKKEQVMKEVLRYAAEIEAEKIIIGLPLQLNGKEGIESNRARDFAADLANYTDLPVEFMDERLTSVEADRMMQLEGVRRDKRKATIDARAAAIILQTYLDRETYTRRAENPTF